MSSTAPVAVCSPLGAVNVGPVRWLMLLYVTLSYSVPYLIWWPPNTLVAFTEY